MAVTAAPVVAASPAHVGVLVCGPGSLRPNRMDSAPRLFSSVPAVPNFRILVPHFVLLVGFCRHLFPFRLPASRAAIDDEKTLGRAMRADRHLDGFSAARATPHIRCTFTVLVEPAVHPACGETHAQKRACPFLRLCRRRFHDARATPYRRIRPEAEPTAARPVGTAGSVVLPRRGARPARGAAIPRPPFIRATTTPRRDWAGFRFFYRPWRPATRLRRSGTPPPATTLPPRSPEDLPTLGTFRLPTVGRMCPPQRHMIFFSLVFCDL